jgi:hypothetical protein
MKRGSGGKVGGGIYFADSIAVADSKALHGSGSSGVVIECSVAMGVMKVLNSCTNESFFDLLNNGYDSVHLKKYDEWIVYNMDQVRLERCLDGGTKNEIWKRK